MTTIANAPTRVTQPDPHAPIQGSSAPLAGLTVAPRGHDLLDRFERPTSPAARAVARGADSGRTDQYRTMERILAGHRAGDDMLIDHEVEKLIHLDAKPATAAEQEARNAFLRAAAKAGYDISGAPHYTNR